MQHFGSMLALAICAAALEASPCSAQWTQFGGPNRDFHAPAGKLAPTWPDAGPAMLWRRELGDGYSGILVDGDRLFTMYRNEGHEVVVSLARESGKTIWEHRYPVETTSSAQEYGDGPASTPTIAGDKLISVGIGIDIHCYEKTTGTLLWSRDIMEEFEIPMPGRGHSTSPLVYAELVIVSIGGTDESNAKNDLANKGIKDAAILAFDLNTGDEIWGSTNFPESKASPMLIEFEGRTHLVIFTGNELAGLDPASGELLWRYDHATDFGFNCSSPVFDGVDTILCSSGYNNRAEAVRLEALDGNFVATRVWASRRLAIHFTNLLFVDGLVFGSSGTNRAGMLTCLDALDGEMLWRSRDFARANLIYTGEQYLIFDEDGQLALCNLSPEGIEVVGRLAMETSSAFTAPTLVGTELYVRNRSHLTALDLSAEALQAATAGEGAFYSSQDTQLPAIAPSLLGFYETPSKGAEPSRIEIRIEGHWLRMDMLNENSARLEFMPDQGIWEFVDDRTSGSRARTLEFHFDSDNKALGFTLRSPRVQDREYRLHK